MGLNSRNHRIGFMLALVKAHNLIVCRERKGFLGLFPGELIACKIIQKDNIFLVVVATKNNKLRRTPYEPYPRKALKINLLEIFDFFMIKTNFFKAIA